MTAITTKTKLVLNQFKQDLKKKESVNMVLNSKYDVLWVAEETMKEVDRIEAKFLDNIGETNEQGKITVSISLLGGARFTSPYLTVPADQTLECIEFQTKRSKTILVLTFLEPQEGQHLEYPHIYFHIKEGKKKKTIDPSVSVTRGVGG